MFFLFLFVFFLFLFSFILFYFYFLLFFFFSFLYFALCFFVFISFVLNKLLIYVSLLYTFQRRTKNPQQGLGRPLQFLHQCSLLPF